jgi:hypothetical protein
VHEDLQEVISQF